jgi:hypothetical protein
MAYHATICSPGLSFVESNASYRLLGQTSMRFSRVGTRCKKNNDERMYKVNRLRSLILRINQTVHMRTKRDRVLGIYNDRGAANTWRHLMDTHNRSP